jgi:hypothetical protein
MLGDYFFHQIYYDKILFYHACQGLVKFAACARLGLVIQAARELFPRAKCWGLNS